MGGATRSQLGARSPPQPRSLFAFASLRQARPAPRAYGLQRPLSSLVLRALSPHRSVGLVVTAVPFHRHYGLCLYRLPPLLFVLKAPPLAVLRSPHRVLRPRLAPFRGWSLPSPPTRGALVVSHSCQSPRPLVAGTGIPRPVGAERLGLPLVAPLFCRLPL